MKKSASCLLAAASLASSLAFAQPAPYSPDERIHWIDGQTVTLTYSHDSAPGGVSTALMADVLADIEAKFDGLNLPGLNVAIGNREIANGCAGQARNTVHICWEPRSDSTAVSSNAGQTDGSSFWRQSYILLPSNATFTEASLYSTLMHHMLHMLGFGHPATGESVQNTAGDLTSLDISGLQTMFGAGACALTYDAATGTVDIPFVTYAGGAYAVKLQQSGATEFSLDSSSIRMFNAQNLPTSRCQGLRVDGNNDLHIPEVRVGGGLYWANLRLQGDRLVLTGSGQ